ncbi:MAG: response regulator [Flavobacteriales bacterium]|nr:response regulator [Flavobacteriales bacterium]
MKKHKVLLFEDNQHVREVMILILQKKYEVKALENVENVVKNTLDFLPQIILMDLWIPPTGGVSAAKLLKENSITKEIPLVFCSANNDIAMITENSKADGFILKPFRKGDLLSCIEIFLSEFKPVD